MNDLELRVYHLEENVRWLKVEIAQLEVRLAKRIAELEKEVKPNAGSNSQLQY